MASRARVGPKSLVTGSRQTRDAELWTLGAWIDVEMLPEPNVTVLGRDPAQRKFNINCNAFQQDALVSFNGWQYSSFYTFLQSEPSGAAASEPPEPLYVHLGRRQLPRGSWEVMVLDDYPQTTDDGHNTVQMGICPGDGTIHLSYDHHCDVLVFTLGLLSRRCRRELEIKLTMRQSQIPLLGPRTRHESRQVRVDIGPLHADAGLPPRSALHAPPFRICDLPTLWLPRR